MAGHRADDPTLNDDSQPSVTNSTEALKQADLIAGVPPAVVAVKPPADAIDLEVRKAKADVSTEEVAANLVPAASGETDAGTEAMAEAGEEVGEDGDFGTGPYEGRTVAQLKAKAESLGLSTSGTKDELIDRLRA